MRQSKLLVGATLAALASLTALAGCDGGNAAPRSASNQDGRGGAAPAAVAARDSAGRAEIGRSVRQVRADVDRIQVASAAEQKQLLPAHVQAVKQMVDRFESKVRAMHVERDPGWVAVIDSVRADLAKMPGMSAEELHAYLPDHNRRVMRIVACVDMVTM